MTVEFEAAGDLLVKVGDLLVELEQAERQLRDQRCGDLVADDVGVLGRGGIEGGTGELVRLPNLVLTNHRSTSA